MTEHREEPPAHPFWCDDCGAKAGFTLKGCAIDHALDCPRFGENPEHVYEAAKDYCRRTGRKIQ